MKSINLRPYQQQAVDATLAHFRQSDQPAVIVLPTGAGKSLVIAELARLARYPILVLAHVKELVEQNHEKYQHYGKRAGIFAAGLNKKQLDYPVTFASVQSVSRNLAQFNRAFSLLIIDECHRLNEQDSSQYMQVINHLKTHNSRLRVLGLTATPFRLGQGWIYQYHYRGFVRTTEPRFFNACIYELPLSYMIRHGYLTPAKMVDAPVAQYDFSTLSSNAKGEYAEAEVNNLLVRHHRVTRSIIEQVEELAHKRQGVMIFAATVAHAEEVASYLPAQQVALITGQTPPKQRDQYIQAFKQRQLKYLVNVAVLTTGFDAPHVDLIAILRPTQSVSLYQQIVGRGLRLAEGKKECLVMDYAGNGIDIHLPEVGSKKPGSDYEPVQVMCPQCGFANIFWGKTDDQRNVIEHFGRRCQGLLLDEANRQSCCDYRFRFKECPHCNAQNDIAARQCGECGQMLVDPDEQLKAALQLKDALVLRCAGMTLSRDKQRLKVIYHDEDGTEVSEWFDMANKKQRELFNQQFGQRAYQAQNPQSFASAEQAVAEQQALTAPDFVVARRKKHFWQVKQRVFDYQGQYRKANQLN